MCSNPLLIHPAEEAFERYLLNQSSESEVEALEKHYLACHHCVSRLEQIDVQIRGVKLALQDIHIEKTALAVARQQKKTAGWWSLAGLSTAAGLTMAAAMMLSITPGGRKHNLKPAIIQMTAFRGVESRILPRDREIQLALNVQGLAQKSAIVSLVNEDGVELWRNSSPIENNTLLVDLPAIHTTGNHIIRIYAEADSVNPKREISVNVE